MRKILIAALLLMAPVVTLAASEEYQEDVHYKKVEPEQSGAEGKRIQIYGFFMYACGHCNNLEPYLEEWLKQKPEDVDFVKVPAMFDRPEIIRLAKTYYALQLIGAGAEIHGKLFHAIHIEKRRLRTKAEIDGFLQANGIDMPKYHNAMKSFAILTSTRKAAVLAEEYSIHGVPALGIDGKYLVSGQEPETMIGVMNQLIDKVRKAKAAVTKQPET